MTMRLLIPAFSLALLTAMAVAQAQAPAPPAAKPAAAKAVRRPTGTLAQLMRGVYFPNANLIYDVQQIDPGVPKKKGDGSGSSTDTYSNTYSGWEIVENAAIALTDGVDLILMPGRTCQNGKPVPLQQADFQKFARDMREAGLVALRAARAKNQEKVSDATNNIADACVSCHEVYRDKGPADSPARCTPPPKQ
jgi:cytochrome c556